MFSQVNDDFEDSPRTPTTQRSITQRPGDSSGPGDNHVRPLFEQHRCIPRSFDIPRSPTHVMEDRKRNKAKADRDQPPEEHNTGAAKKHRKLTYHEAYVCSFSDGDWRCPSASSKIPDWAPYLPGGIIFKALVENTAEAFYSGTSGIEAAPNSGPKSKWGSYSEAARREIQRNDEKPGKSRWYYFVLF